MKEGKNIKARQSNFELMRIISMFMIVLWHCISHTNILGRTSGNLNLLLELIFMFTAVHVNSFILLSGYFGFKNEFNIIKEEQTEGIYIFLAQIIKYVKQNQLTTYVRGGGYSYIALLASPASLNI